jgi:glycosyltransferase involved in cell wall biosynthesis
MVQASQVVKLDGIGVDLEEFRFAPPVKHPITFLMMGRLLIDKGVYEFVDAARLVRRKYPETRFILLGSTDANPRTVTLEELEAWKTHNVVDWPGRTDDVRPWLAKASVFVLPSYYREGLPRSTQEAMAMGRAIITSNSVGCRDTIEDGRNGYLIPPQDAEALAAAMLRFIEDPQLIVQMGVESRKIAERRYDVNLINGQILGALGINPDDPIAT